jgi:hypothetical protein
MTAPLIAIQVEDYNDLKTIIDYTGYNAEKNVSIANESLCDYV